MPRAKGVQIYLKPGLEEDDRLLAFWHACQRHSRPQEVFRRLLQVGLDELCERGEISPRILREVDEELAGRPTDPFTAPPRERKKAGAAEKPGSRQQTGEVPSQPMAMTSDDTPREPSRPLGAAAQPEPAKGGNAVNDREIEEERPDEITDEASDTDRDPHDLLIAEVTDAPLEEDKGVTGETETGEPGEAGSGATGAATPKEKYGFIGDIM
ncbi:hypothetical protein [Salipiger sp. PrR003]|uniref:hypothetical protein n=1 Tax=Salipiger sp. PrR003 TaxID=2706776 RepID=UPI0013DD59B6|nr:hypothetical protein [Salipiger sp. PrR003]NDV50749.1 hypothetical protein [Salipiger sp. PrR003]